MKTTAIYPLVSSVTPLAGKRLLVTFANGGSKIYDCSPLLEEEAFRPLQDDTLFNSVHVDPHGYAVIWSDEIDLAESEIWINGETVSSPADR